LVRKPEGKRQLGTGRRKWEDNIKMDLTVIGWEDWIHVNEDRRREHEKNFLIL
jgi:hypothetical protein